MKRIIKLLILTICLAIGYGGVNAATVFIGNDTATAGAKHRELSLELKDTDSDLSKYKMVKFELSLSDTDNVSIFNLSPQIGAGQEYTVEAGGVYVFKSADGFKEGKLGIILYNTTDQLANNVTVTPTNVKFYSETDANAEGIDIIDGKVSSGTIKFEKPKSSDASLTELTVSQGTLTPAFNKDTTEYKVVVPDTISIIRLSASAALGATRTGTGSKNLNMGENHFSIEVTAEDGTTKKTYNVTITRGKVTEPSAFIKSLKINGLDSLLSPEFDSKNDKYTVVVPAGTESLDLVYELEDPLANISIEGNEKFVTGENKVTIKVTSSDNEKKQTYEILVTVEEEETTTTKPLPVKKEGKKNKKGILIAIILAIIAIVIGVGFLLFRKKKADESNEKITDSTDNSDIETSENIVNEAPQMPLYNEDKTETYDREKLNQAIINATEEELDKTKEFNFKDM